MKDYIKKNLLWISILVIQVLMCIICEYVNYESYMNSDIASDMLLAKTMAEKGHWVFCSDYIYTTEIHVLHSQLLMQLLFRFISNWKTVFVLSFTISIVAICILCLVLLKIIINDDKYAFLGTTLLIGVGGDYYTLLFNNQSYTAYILFAFLLLILFYKFKDNQNIILGG